MEISKAFGGCAALFLAIYASGAAAMTAEQGDLPDRLDAVVQAYTPGHGFMGAVLVAEGDRVVLNKGYGLADAEWGIPDAPDVEFRIGSLTKQFTAVLVLLLQQDRKLSLSDPIGRYLPNAPVAWREITLAELLGDTSGIPDFTEDGGARAWKMISHTPTEVLALVRNKPLDFKPGTRFEYSSSNYVLLGVIIEKVSGYSYGALLQRRIFTPLGMKHSGLDTDGLVLPKRAQGYRFQLNGVLAHDRAGSMSVPWAAGAIYSTTGDLLRWERALFGGKLLSAAALTAMTTPGLGGYGLGVFVSQWDGHKTVWHNGAIEGFDSSLDYVPDRQLAVVVLSNVLDVPTSDKLAGQLLGVALGKSDGPARLLSRDLDKFAGTYDLAAGFSLSFRRDGDRLNSISDGAVFPAIYEGVKQGHATFFVPAAGAEISFVADSNGSVTSLVLHQGRRDIPGHRR